jgi:uncharacterized protein
LQARFDSHVHIVPPRRLVGLMRWIHRAFPGHPVPVDILRHQIIDDLRSAGVGRFFNLVYPLSDEETYSLNDWNIEFCAETPGAIPFGSMFVDTPDKAKVAERLFERGCVGIKFHPFVQKFDPGDSRFDDLYSLMNEAGKPLLLHTGYDDWYGRSLTAETLRSIAERYPAMGLVLVHMLFPRLDQALKMAADYENVWLDLTNVPGSFRYTREKGMSLPEGLVEQLLDGLEQFGARTMYGSDYPAGMGTLGDVDNDLKALGISESVYRKLTQTSPAAFLERYGSDENVGWLT